MTFSLRLNDEDSNLIKKYAELNGLTVSELLRKSVFERIEDEYDLKCYENAMEEYKKDTTTFSHKDVVKMLDFDEE